MSTEKTEELSAKKIQASMRRFFAKRDYQLPYQPITSCTDYLLRIQGNDPKINLKRRHLSTDRVALIGTSGLRTLEIACQLGSDCPKIFLIDNSQHVILFWRRLQAVMEKSSSAKGIMKKVSPMTCDCSDCMDSMDPETGYLATLCRIYGFDKVKRIVLHASIIPQNWADKKTFQVLSRLVTFCEYQSVYLYASNIVSCMVASREEASAKAILSHIASLNPDLVIHTDLSGRQIPKQVFYYLKNHHDDVETILSNLTATLSARATLSRKAVFESINHQVKVLEPVDLELVNSLVV
ncbi:MAG: hypothetical protein P1U61_05820 [Legionellaceae bacterium]|nr:hypothetical protein [Legionellaceae bacterium]